MFYNDKIVIRIPTFIPITRPLLREVKKYGDEIIALPPTQVLKRVVLIVANQLIGYVKCKDLTSTPLTYLESDT